MTRQQRGRALAVAVLCALAASWPASVISADLDAGARAYEAGDYGQAASVWAPLADAGDPLAQFNMGLLYETGRGVPPDAARAAEWYRRAALQGETAAQHNLAVLLEAGVGVARDRAEALYWLEVAARLAADPAEAARAHAASRALGALLDDAVVAAARARARSFRPTATAAPRKTVAPYLVLDAAGVATVQRRLAALGYDVGEVDGVPGPRTRAAIRRFLEDRGRNWPVDPHLSRSLLDELTAP